MKIIYKDLLNFLSEKPSIDLLSKKLFQLGHEHEINGELFDIELTPNRGDCLSLYGLSRDLNIFFGKSDHIDFYEKSIESLDIKFENRSPVDCPRISFLEIEIEESQPNYKKYLESYFQLMGTNKTNFFTDISNYLSYELGQPTHCYDSERLKGKLIFSNKLCNGSFETLLGTKINLKNKNCVFTIDDNIINLAGLMGGASTACSPNTKKALIECAYFNPESIIGKSVQYGINSDAAYKFERGVDAVCHDKVLRRYIKIVSDHVEIKSLKIKSFDYDDFLKQHLTVDTKKINRIIGIDIDKESYINILEKLDFEVNDNKITVPPHRHDIRSQNDLAEEVARVIGYNNIISSPISLLKKKNDKKSDKEKLLETFCTFHGFTQVINFPFASDTDKYQIKIDNPLDSNRRFLRTNLKTSLVNNFIYNQRRQKESIKLFELSDVYIKNPEITHKKKLGLIVGGRHGLNYKDFAKKFSETYLSDLLNKNLKTKFFNIHEIPVNELGTKKKDKVFYTEAFIDDIPGEFFEFIPNVSKSLSFKKYNSISDFPSSSRDLSFSIDNPKSYNELIKMIDNIEDELVSKFFIFDFYKNEKQEIIKLGVRILFQSHHRTLSEKEVSVKLDKILKPILELKGVFIEGM